MDCIAVFRHPLFPRISISQPYSFIASNIGLGLYRKRPSISTCWAVGVPGDLSDESSASLKIKQNGSVFSALDESSSATFLDAEIIPETIDFFVSDAEGDPDCPTEGYSSIEQVMNTLREGKFVIVVDDEKGDMEGNLVMAASYVSPQAVAFMLKHGSGIVSVGMRGDIFVSMRCDCGNQLDLAMQSIEQAVGELFSISAVMKEEVLALVTSFRPITCKTKAMIQWKPILSLVLQQMHANMG